MNTIAQHASPLLGKLTIDHGPAELLNRFFQHADAAASARGVMLSLGDLAELIEVNEENRDSWLPLFPTYDIRCNTIGTDDAFCIMGCDGHGKVVATHAGRLFNLKLGNFHDLAQSLHLMYEDPKGSKRPGETC